MGIFDKFKKKIDDGDDDLDELDTDADSDEGGDDAPPASFGGIAMGLLNRVKQISSGGDGEEGGGIGGLLSKVKGLSIRNKDTGDPDLDDDDYYSDAVDDSDNTTPENLLTLDAIQDDEDEPRPIRRSGIAPKLDGNSGAAEPQTEDDEAQIPVPVGAGGSGLDLESLFEQEVVINPTLRDLAESLDDVSAAELAADLKTFLEELQ